MSIKILTYFIELRLTKPKDLTNCFFHWFFFCQKYFSKNQFKKKKKKKKKKNFHNSHTGGREEVI